MSKRGWAIEQEEERRILARIQVRAHVAKVWVDYRDPQIAFEYGGSEQLQCKPLGQSCSSIHEKYNVWARNLASDIAREITKRRAAQSPPGAA